MKNADFCIKFHKKRKEKDYNCSNNTVWWNYKKIK